MAKRHSPATAINKSGTQPPAYAANAILAALPSDVRRRLDAQLERLPVKLRQFVRRPGEPVTYVYFPSDGFFSELTVLASGDMVEVVTIGREGMSGWSAEQARPIIPSATMVQAEIGTCHRLSVADFRSEMNRLGPFHQLITRYRQAVMGVVMQTTACNAVHSLEQRLARWFLMAQDRIARDEFPLTQEFVAMMLGAARPTVSIIAGSLQKAGLITYRRGRVRVLNRAGLEAAACECYGVCNRLIRDAVPAPPKA